MSSDIEEVVFEWIYIVVASCDSSGWGSLSESPGGMGKDGRKEAAIMCGVGMLETVNSRFKVVRYCNDSQLETVLVVRANTPLPHSCLLFLIRCP